MITQKNLITLCFATVFTLGLAACGGGGGGDAPVTSMMDGDGSDGDGSLEGKYIPSGTTIPGLEYPDAVLSADSGDEVTVPGLGTVECASDDGCSATVAEGVLTITGDLKIVSVDPALDSETATVLAGLAVDMLAEPTELETVQTDAAKAATDARTAATDAQTAADAADTARANRATIQTGDLHGGNSGAHAMYAQGHADDADTAATNAETASAAAAEATTVSDATRELVAAETALADATTAKGKAEGSRDEAMTASGKEVKIVDKTKMVGTTSITIDGSTLDETRNEARKVTGKVGDITTMSDAVVGVNDGHCRSNRQSACRSRRTKSRA